MDKKRKDHEPPNTPGEGVRVAMIEHIGAPIELIEFRIMKNE